MQLRFVICIPVYDNPKTISEVIQRCISATEYPIVVVDDGSSTPVSQLLSDDLKANKRLHLIRHQENQGKGESLKTALKYSIENAWTHMITIDGDGQHFPEEIAKLTQASYKNPWALIIGVRQMEESANVPKSSIVGRRIANFWVHYETEINVGDSQSGFRIYPLFYLQTKSFFAKRYDFEAESMTRMLWSGCDLVTVPISVSYAPGKERITHFNKLWDNVKIVFVNVVMVLISLVRRTDPPLKSAVAVAIGVFIGCFPIYGLHSFLAFVASVLLRSNFIFMWLGTNISIPPLIPFLILGAKYFSEKITGHPPEGFFALSRDWIIGISFLALLLSVSAGILVYIVKKWRMRDTSQVAVKTKRHLGIWIMAFVIKFLGLRTTYACMYIVVPFFFIFSFKARKSSREFYFVLYKKRNFFKQQAFLWRQLFVFSKVLVDRGFQRLNQKKYFNVVESLDVGAFKEALTTSNKGLSVLLSHYGGWEIIFNYFQHLMGHKKMVAVKFGIPGSYDHSSLNTKKTEKLNLIEYNLTEGTADQLRNYLLEGHAIGLMADRPVGRNYELLPLLGKLALVDTSAIRLSLMCSVDIYCVFSVKKSISDYEVIIKKIDVNQVLQMNLSKEDQIIYIAQTYFDCLSAVLKEHPEQWFNFYPFWSQKLFN